MSLKKVMFYERVLELIQSTDQCSVKWVKLIWEDQERTCQTGRYGRYILIRKDLYTLDILFVYLCVSNNSKPDLTRFP